MSEFANYVEYCVEKRAEGAYFWKRLGLIVFCVVVGLAIIPVVTYTEAGRFFIAFVPVWMGIMGIVYWFFSRFTHIEYEYRIVQGEFQMDVIYGQRQRKQMFAQRIREMIAIRPLTEEDREKVLGCAKVTNCAISLKKPTPDIYYYLYEDKDRNTCAVLFEATRKTLEIMKFYNSQALVIKQDLRH